MSDFSDYINPPPKAPYQLGDFAVVTNFIPRGPQTKRSAVNINKIGIVVGYKNVPGAYSKYLLKFDDGNKDGYMPTYLKGPFSDKSVAQKYSDDPNKEIEPSDLKAKKGKVLSNEWESLPKVEDALKKILTQTFLFTWFDVPKRIESDLLTVVTFKLAQLKDFPDICLIRSHDRYTRKLKGSSYSNKYAKGYQLYLPDTKKLDQLIANPKKDTEMRKYGEVFSASIDAILKPKPGYYWNVLENDYIEKYKQVFQRVFKVRDMEKSLPEIEGLF